MERGHRRALPVAEKIDRGTYSPGRDGHKVQIITAGDPPQMPDYLTPEAEVVWQEVIGRVMSVGATEVDSGLVGRYCAMEALSRKTLGMGEPIPAAMMTALRQYEELLRIAGPKSRVGVKPDGQSANPFARNGRR